MRNDSLFPQVTSFFHNKSLNKRLRLLTFFILTPMAYHAYFGVSHITLQLIIC